MQSRDALFAEIPGAEIYREPAERPLYVTHVLLYNGPDIIQHIPYRAFWCMRL